jgi:hypothetical protein
MTIALFGISNLYNSIQNFMNASALLQSPRADAVSQTSSTSHLANRQRLPGSFAVHPTNPRQKALRVLRIAEQGDTSACAGRMVISGRMADVCAELDRLVALEAKNHKSLPH